MNAPRRAFTLELSAGADTWGDLVAQLRQILPHIEEHGPACSSVSGGYSSGHVVTVLQNPHMTHERYFTELQQYLAEAKP